MKNKYYIPSILGGLLLIAVLVAGCKKDDELEKAPRLFSPYVKETKVTGTSIRISWDKYSGAEKYQLMISKDSLTTSPIAAIETDTTFCLFENLEWDTQYQVYIQAFGGGLSSNLKREDIKTNDYPTKLISPSTEDVIDNAVIIRWDTGDVFDKIRILNGKNEFVKEIDLTDTDYALKKMTIEDLSAATTYKIMAFAGDDYKGKKVVTTMAAQTFDGAVVDLRSLTDAEALDYITTAFIAGLEDGTTVVLSGGTVYKINAAVITEKSIKFTTGYSFKGKAKFAIVSNFRLPSVNVAKIEFEGINFYTLDATVTSANYGAQYIFNAGNGNATLISFEKCEFKFFRGVVRLQAGSTINKIVMNDCIVDRVAGYGVMNVDDASATIKEMVLTNSTVTYADKILVNTKSSTTTKVSVENCTFCYSPADGGSSYMFDFNGQGPEISIKNSVFGPTTTNAAGGAFFRASSTPTVTGCYTTSDCKVYVNPTTSASFPIPDASSYGKSSTQIFADPANLDFTIIDTSFPSTAGDPRWRK